MRSNTCIHDFQPEVGNAGDITNRCTKCLAFFDEEQDRAYLITDAPFRLGKYVIFLALCIIATMVIKAWW